MGLMGLLGRMETRMRPWGEVQRPTGRQRVASSAGLRRLWLWWVACAGQANFPVLGSDVLDTGAACLGRQEPRTTRICC